MVGYDRAVLALILLFFIVMNGTYLFNESTWSDEALYAKYAEMLRAQPLSFFSPEIWEHHPPLFSAIAALMPAEPLLAIRLASFIFSLAGITLVYLFGKKHISENTGLVAAFLLASNTVYAMFSYRGIIDVPLAAIFTVCGILALENLRGKYAIALLIFLAIAALMKEAGLIILPILFFYLVFCRSGLVGLKKALLATFGLGGFLTVSALLPFIGFNLGRISIVIILFFYGILLVPFASGYVQLFRIHKKVATYLGLWIVTVFSIVAAINFDLRFLFPALPAICIVTAFGIAAFYQTAKLRYAKHAKSIVIIFVVLFVVASTTGTVSMNATKAQGYLGFQEAGAWIKENVPQEYKIYATGVRQVGFFSERNFFGADQQIFSMPKNYDIDCTTSCIVVVDFTEANYAEPAQDKNYSELVGYLEHKGFFKESEVWRTISGKLVSVVTILGKKNE